VSGTNPEKGKEIAFRSFVEKVVKQIGNIKNNSVFCTKIYLFSENILIKDDLVKLADFGSCRGIYSAQPCTEYISTRWYRAPECLMTDGYYSYKMDMWGVGCVIYEMLTFVPLFSGNDEYD
jgi:renal tumor antigen